MRGTAADPRELFNAIGGFGNRADRRFIQGGFDGFGVRGQFADGSDDVPAPQAIKTAITVGGEVALNGGSADTRDLAGLQTGQPRMNRPQHEHLATNMQIGMQVPFGSDDRLLGFRESDMDACHP